MGKSTGGASGRGGGGGFVRGRFTGTQRQANRVLRFPSGVMTGRGSRVIGRIQTVQGQINRTGDSLADAKSRASGTYYNSAERSRNRKMIPKLQARMGTLQARRATLQRAMGMG